ncbi:hypothetical protein ILYODFUR_009183 [Ilyodon furcidens]|uniref:Uncharacterized protein n=1 Tax=Ilyodon furcidens TaxID=33524 RepID=A0ABV0T7M2_9TELE
MCVLGSGVQKEEMGGRSLDSFGSCSKSKCVMCLQPVTLQPPSWDRRGCPAMPRIYPPSCSRHCGSVWTSSLVLFTLEKTQTAMVSDVSTLSQQLCTCWFEFVTFYSLSSSSPSSQTTGQH